MIQHDLLSTSSWVSNYHQPAKSLQQIAITALLQQFWNKPKCYHVLMSFKWLLSIQAHILIKNYNFK